MKYKIHYNKEGWLCERYPYDLQIEDENRFIEVDEETYNKTLGCDNHYSWRVVDGQLVHEQYEPIPEEEIVQTLRDKRAEICFPIINRGQLFYESLNVEQKQELATWYKQWLDAPNTKTEPPIPRWLSNGGKDE